MSDQQSARQSATLAALDSAIEHARRAPIPAKLTAIDSAIEALRQVLHEQHRRLCALEADRPGVQLRIRP